jgi:hypothetical protein
LISPTFAHGFFVQTRWEAIFWQTVLGKRRTYLAYFSLQSGKSIVVEIEERIFRQMMCVATFISAHKVGEIDRRKAVRKVLM